MCETEAAHGAECTLCYTVCAKYETSLKVSNRLSPDSGLSPGPLQGVRVTDQLVQHVDDLAELWPVRPLPLPAVQHELMERHGAVHGRRQPVAFHNRFDHLERHQSLLSLCFSSSTDTSR